MTNNLFTWNQKQNKLVNASVILEEQRVVQGVKINMDMISNANTAVSSYFCCAKIFRL